MPAKKSSNVVHYCTRVLLLLYVALTVGCTTGPLKVEEVYYLAATNGEDTNYYRITVKANTQLGVAEYRSGMFPASAVDALFGDVSQEGSAKASLVRDQLKGQIDAALLQAHKDYETVAKNPETTDEQLQKYLATLARVRFVPFGRDFQVPKSVTIQYDPLKGLTILRSDEKFVWVLSSNPDDVIGSIANFAEQEATEKAVLKFADVVVQSTRNEAAQRRARNTAGQTDDKLIAAQIDAALAAIEKNPTRPVAIEQVETLRQLLLALQGGGQS
jgi:hypothetical protein